MIYIVLEIQILDISYRNLVNLFSLIKFAYEDSLLIVEYQFIGFFVEAETVEGMLLLEIIIKHHISEEESQHIMKERCGNRVIPLINVG